MSETAREMARRMIVENAWYFIGPDTYGDEQAIKASIDSEIDGLAPFCALALAAHAMVEEHRKGNVVIERPAKLWIDLYDAYVACIKAGILKTETDLVDLPSSHREPHSPASESSGS